MILFSTFFFVETFKIFPGISRMFPLTSWSIFYNNCFEVLANSNSCVALAPASIDGLLPRMGGFSWLCVCGGGGGEGEANLALLLNILNITLWDLISLNLDSKSLPASVGFGTSGIFRVFAALFRHAPRGPLHSRAGPGHWSLLNLRANSVLFRITSAHAQLRGEPRSS